ncbi:MAG: hypothetical protein ABJA81_08365 [Nocardioidaceae bacterium]
MHVGVAKTGTTYLQRLLFANGELLRKNGVLYPGSERDSHFKASLDLRDSRFQGHRYPDSDGAWQAFVTEINAYDGTGLVSHESLARTRRQVIRHAVDSFTTDDVRIVLTTRDLGRQIPAVWQENVKNRNQQTYTDFVDEIFASRDVRGSKLARFWAAQDLPRLVQRWADIVSHDNITLVTLPPPGAEREELWRRFATAVELPDLPYSFDIGIHNASLGAVESELLRRLNSRLAEDLDWPAYEYRIKRLFVLETLSPLHSGAPIVVPEKWHDQVREISDEMITRLRAQGCRVIGDLDDLRPARAPASTPLPDEISEAEMLEASLRVLGRVASAPPPPPATTSIRAASRVIVDRLKERLKHE